MSITNPAMQTLPKGPVVRDAFIARPGYKLLSVDYEQIEARIFASEAEELPMIQAILDYDAGSGVDLHTFVARVVYGDPTIIKSDPRRNLAKNTIFCTIYGGGAAKIAETAGVELEVAEAFLAKFLETFPGVRRFQKATESLGRQREKSEGVAYTHSVSGRYHSLLPDEGVYKLTNYRIQGSAADVLKERMVSLDNAGFGDYMLLPVHDEVVFEMPDEWALDAVPHIKTCMEDFESFAVPLLVSASDPHPRWGACK
jgi:DNA polymerase-1